MPINAILAGGWFYNPDTFYKKSFAPGFDITATTAGGTSLQRVPPLDMTLVGVGMNWNNRGCQVCTDNNNPPKFNIALNFAGTKGGELHIIWGSWTDNSSGGATLTVVDNTNNLTFTAPTYPDLTFNIAYNSTWWEKESVFLVGQTQSVTASVQYTQASGRAWLQSAWIKPMN